MHFLAKLLQACGIALLMVGLILGLQGDMAAQYYYFFAGIGVFLIGYIIQKNSDTKNKHRPTQGTNVDPHNRP
jgi:hypothetical protein